MGEDYEKLLRQLDGDCEVQPESNYLTSAAAAAIRALVRERHQSCGTCGGAPPESGLACICGGSGSALDETDGLRRHALSLESQLAAVTAERDEALKTAAGNRRLAEETEAELAAESEKVAALEAELVHLRRFYEQCMAQASELERAIAEDASPAEAAKEESGADAVSGCGDDH